MTYEAAAGVMAIAFAITANAIGQDVAVWHAAVAGLAGITGAWIFINPETMSAKGKIIAVLTGTALASLFGPILARYFALTFQWVGVADYFVSAAAGMFVGLVCTPVLRLLHNPAPALTVLASLIPWWGKRHGKD